MSTKPGENADHDSQVESESRMSIAFTSLCAMFEQSISGAPLSPAASDQLAKRFEELLTELAVTFDVHLICTTVFLSMFAFLSTGG